MRNRNATARMQDLFTSYHTLLVRNGLEWLMKGNPKVAVNYVLSAVKPETLHDRLSSDLSLSHHDLRKDFLGILKHAIKPVVAFQFVGTGASSRSGNPD